MPLCSLHLLSLTCPPQQYLKQLSTNKSIVLASQPHNPPVIRVGHDGERINATQWHLLVILAGKKEPLRDDTSLGDSIKVELMLSTGIPTKLVEAYRDRRSNLITDIGPPLAFNIVACSGSTSSSSQTISPSPDSQNLELSNGLVDFAHRLQGETAGKGPVWMLNLLKFKEGHKENYINYGRAFAKVAQRFGGQVVLVGSVSDSHWDEFALAHYPSISHFVDMSADGSPGGYQEINRRWRLGSLEDTGIICTTPLDVPPEGRAKM